MGEEWSASPELEGPSYAQRSDAARGNAYARARTDQVSRKVASEEVGKVKEKFTVPKEVCEVRGSAVLTFAVSGTLKTLKIATVF